jgi:hypothetical protein
MQSRVADASGERRAAMRVLARWLSVFLVLGCNEVATGETIQVRFSVRENFEQTPLEGAKICLSDTPTCATTDANGGTRLSLPANRKLSYTVETEGYESILYPVVTGMDGGDLPNSVYSNAWLADNFANLQSPYPMTDRGMIHMIITPRIAGATFDLVDATGKPFYKDEADNWSSDLEATTSGGIGIGTCCAAGGFVEVVPGEYLVEIGGTAQDCALSETGALPRGWPGDAPNRFVVPVQEGFSTRTVLSCTVPR